MRINVSAPVDKEILFKTAEEGNIKRLKEIIEYTGTNLDQRDDEGNDTLHYAALSDDRETLEYLVERCSFSPLRGNRRGITPYDVAYKGKKNISLEYFGEVTGFKYEEGYHNPVERGFFPDPSLIRVGDDYYMVNSSFHFFPCIPISHSVDLVHWKVIGYAITNPEWAELDDKDGGRGYWAPDISYSDGRFYITATLRCNDDSEEKRVQMVTSSTSPEGPYCRPSWIHDDGIDPSLFHDDDGKKYMLLNRGARIFQLSSDCSEKIGEASLLWLGVCRKNPEGPRVMKKDGYYYLFLAEGGTGMGHRVTVARSKTLYGPYEPCPHNPIVRQNDESQLLQCCGHGMVVDTPEGDWYIAYLTLRRSPDGYGFTGRETCIDPLVWDKDGWPLVNGGKGPGVFSRIPKKTKSTKEYPDAEYYPAWKGKLWNTPRALSLDKIKTKGDSLLLEGSGVDLNSKASRSVLLERQSEFEFSAQCVLDTDTIKEGESAGIASYYDENSYIKFGIAVKDGKKGILLSEYVGDGYKEISFTAVDGIVGDVVLREECYGKRRVFSTSSYSFTVEDAVYLSSEGLVKGKRFTGAMVGIYVEGNSTVEFKDWNTTFHSEDTF